MQLRLRVRREGGCCGVVCVWVINIQTCRKKKQTNKTARHAQRALWVAFNFFMKSALLIKI